MTKADRISLGRMNRRGLLASAAASLLSSPALAEGDGGWWESYCRRFVNPSGRIMDDAHRDATHSEGQSWAMLLSVRMRDEATFDLLRAWTQHHLACRPDALLAWLYRPGAGVVDRNNATDADLYHALALIEADRLWPWKRLAGEARRIADDCLRVLMRRANGLSLLLPGATGFEGRWSLDLNPSYILPRIFRLLHAETGNAQWGVLERDGRRFLEAALFSRWQLPPDWVRLNLFTGGLTPVPGRTFRFSYDALRVPMNLAWSRDDDHPAFRSVARFWAQEYPPPPAWVSLDDGRLSPFRGDEGHVAVQALTSGIGPGVPPGAPGGVGGRYYAATLGALCREIARERDGGRRA